jgi:hypothetical protein
MLDLREATRVGCAFEFLYDFTDDLPERAVFHQPWSLTMRRGTLARADATVSLKPLHERLTLDNVAAVQPGVLERSRRREDGTFSLRLVVP